MTFQLPASVAQALSAIEAGEPAREFESETLDFKEDPAVYPQNRNPDAVLVDFLADEAVCFSNADHGAAFIVLGVNDKAGGPAAFTGTSRAIGWLVDKIFCNTEPSIRVEGIELERGGARIVVLRVPPGLTLYQRPKGQAARRNGTRCEPLREEQRRQIFFDRANPDYTALPSRRDVSELDPMAIDQARQMLHRQRRLRGKGEPVPGTARELCAELGLLTPGGDLTFAAEILFMPTTAGRSFARHLLRTVPGGSPVATEIAAPLVTTFLRLKELVGKNASREVARIQFPSGEEVMIPAFPDTAVDEIISNAFAHRDWDAYGAVVIDQGPTSLTVWSPGPLPAGVREDRLLTTQSIPRNPLLMAGLRMLGLVEESSRGFDRMWVSMLASGRKVPTVMADRTFVEVTLSSGQIDESFVQAVSRLQAEFGPEPFDSANGLILARHLHEHPVILTAMAAKLMQVNADQADEILHWFASLGFVEQLPNAPEWVLSSRGQMTMDLSNQPQIPPVSVSEQIKLRLFAGEAVTARDIADELGLDRKVVTEKLRELRISGSVEIDPEGPSRGPNTRWMRAQS